MLYQSVEFFLFISCIFLVLSFIKDNKSKRLLLFIGSCFFYGFWNAYFLPLLLFSITTNYWIGKKLDFNKSSKIYLTLGLFANFSTLFFFKYFDYTLSLFEINSPIDVVLPIGISFYTFQGVSYLIDLYRGKIKSYDSISDFGLYISFFPQLIAGPIVRADDFKSQLSKIKLNINRNNIYLFAKGLFKKVIIADNLAYFVNGVFKDIEHMSSLSIIAATLFFYIQIYCDFSGYTDMAIALGRTFGINLPQNFKNPFAANSLTNFWHRWHITLSTWFRDYVYIPLGGKNKLLLSIFITMLLAGLWHGAASNFIIWGALHGFILILEKKLFNKIKVSRFIQIIITQTTVVILWFFFRVENLNDIVLTANSFVNKSHFNTNEITYLQPIITLCCVSLFVFGKHLEPKAYDITKKSNKHFLMFIAFFTVLFFFTAPDYQEPFIYFQF